VTGFTFDSTIYCGHCEFCRRGLINLCDHRRVLGVSCEDYRQNGAFAEFVAVPQRILYRLPDGLTFEHAALVEPFAIAVHAFRRAPPALNDFRRGCGRRNDRPGAGASAKPGRLRAPHRGWTSPPTGSPWRQSSARTDIINTPRAKNAPGAILQLTHGLGVDLAFEAVGRGGHRGPGSA